MADRITDIETQLGNVLLDIGATGIQGYTYLSDVKGVNFEQDDEVLAITRSVVSNGYPTILVTMDPNELILSGEAKAYTSELSYVLDCKVAIADPVPNPKQALKQKMNELAQDIKYCISNNYHLNGTVDEAELIYTTRQYQNDGNTLRSGNLKVGLKVTYTQSRKNPAINVCK